MPQNGHFQKNTPLVLSVMLRESVAPVDRSVAPSRCPPFSANASSLPACWSVSPSEGKLVVVPTSMDKRSLFAGRQTHALKPFLSHSLSSTFLAAACQPGLRQYRSTHRFRPWWSGSTGWFAVHRLPLCLLGQRHVHACIAAL